MTKYIITTTLIAFLAVIGLYFFLLNPNNFLGNVGGGLNSLQQTIFPLGNSKNANTAISATSTSSSSPSAFLNNNSTSTTYLSLSTFDSLGPWALKSGSSTIFYLLNKENGNLYTIKNQSIVRLTNQTIRDIAGAFLAQSATKKYLVLQSIDNNLVNNNWYILNQSSSSTLKQLTINPSFDSIAISPQQDKAFYLKQIGGKTIGYIFNFKTLNQSQVWESDYNDWLITWPTDNLIALQTKTSGQVPSNLYFLNPSNGSVIKILSNINGLSSLVSPDGNLILYSLTYNNNPYLYLLDLKAKTNLRLKVKTLANKCLWENDNSLIYCAVPQTLPAANYPDDWYQGKLIFNDEIWSINPSTKETTRIFNFNTINKSFDIDKLLKDQNNLFYLHDKKTGQIWTFDLSAD